MRLRWLSASELILILLALVLALTVYAASLVRVNSILQEQSDWQASMIELQDQIIFRQNDRILEMLRDPAPLPAVEELTPTF